MLDAVVKADHQKESAAAYYLRDLPEDFVPGQNRLFREQLVQAWDQSHAQSNEAKKQLAKLEEDAKERALTIEERWQHVRLLSEVQDDNATIPFLKTTRSVIRGSGRDHRPALATRVPCSGRSAW